jgi:type I restriction enzyme, S subunit
MKYSPYPSYKPCSLDWLGKIPEHWDIWKVTHGFERLGSGTTPTSGVAEYYDGDIPWVTTSELRENLISDTKNTISRKALQEFSALKLYPPGTLLFAMYGATIGRMGLLGIHACVNQACGAFTGPRFLDTKFTFYWLWMRRPVLISLSAGGGQPNLSQDDLREIRIASPPLSEQRAIASFLDHETAKIDALIAKKQRMVELLNEKRSAIISQAVTKGLDPKVPMKDSGIEWLGEIPRHWEVVKTKYVAGLHTGHTPSRSNPDYWEDCTIPWFTLADVWQLRHGRKWFLGDTKEKISKVGLANSSAELLPTGTVIVSRTASVGFSGIMPEPMATTQDFVNWVCGKRVIPKYLLLVFRSMTEEFRRLIMGSTHQTIYMPDAASFRTPLPPIGEQESIVEYVRRKTHDVDMLEDRTQLSLQKLNEYRSALVSAAVTGKIDVRNHAPATTETELEQMMEESG